MSTATDAAGNVGTSTGAAIYGTSGNSTLVSTSGNDIMTGGSGADTFVFNGTHFGNDVITDFQAQGWNHDIIQISSSAVKLAQVTQVGADVVVTFGAADSITLQNVSLTKLMQSDVHII